MKLRESFINSLKKPNFIVQNSHCIPPSPIYCQIHIRIFLHKKVIVVTPLGNPRFPSAPALQAGHPP